MTRRDAISALTSTAVSSCSLLGTLSLLLSAGCTSADTAQPDVTATDPEAGVQDWRRGDGQCSLHGRKMETITVNRIAGPAPQITRAYYEAKEKAFPNCGIEYPPSLYSKERGKIYVCPVCEENRKAWKPGQ